ncbi:MAG: NnrU family protein [Beijerinckiaceae bacterium]
MTMLILGLVLFLGMHSFTMLRGPRAALVGKLGEGGYKGLYTLASLAGFALIIWGYGSYRAGGYVPVWEPPVFMRHIAALLLLPALPLLFSAYAQGFVKARLKHPMILAVKLWALAHLLANGDLGSIVLFGAFLAWAVVAFMSMRRRTGVEAKSFVPNPGQDAAAILGGLIAWAALAFGLHRWLFGVGVFG